MGALANYRWDTLNSVGFCELRGNFGGPYTSMSCQLQLDVEYTLKARVTTNPDASTDYKYKMWPSSETEPNWDLEFTSAAGDPQDPDSNPSSGCVGLLSHHVDAHFGDVILTRYDD